jgi:PAS domain S-box-containing protein
VSAISQSYQPIFLNEIWVYGLTNQIYFFTLLLVFSLVAYMFIKSRREQGNFELNTMEQKSYLQAFATYSEQCIAVLDHNSKIKFANARFLQLFNLKAQEIEGKHVSETSLPATLTEHILKNSEGIIYVGTDSDTHRKQVFLHPITTADGENIGKLILIRGFSLMSEDVNKSIHECESDRISHELKTPLHAIMGYCQILEKDESLSDEHRNYIHTIFDNSKGLLDQVDTVLNETGDHLNHFTPGKYLGNSNIQKVLVVDDVSINRTLLRIMLERRGFSVKEAQNGKEAIDALEIDIPDLVLMDISMPVMDGKEALRKIRNTEGKISELPVIAVTANSRKGNRERLLKAGFNGYLQKPFNESELMDMIRVNA